MADSDEKLETIERNLARVGQLLAVADAKEAHSLAFERELDEAEALLAEVHHLESQVGGVFRPRVGRFSGR